MPYHYCWFWHLETWNIFKECGQDGVGFRLERVYDSVTTTCTKAFITYIGLTVLAPNVLVVRVCGTSIFLLTLCATK